MLHKLKLRAESFDNWVSTVKNALDLNDPKKLGKNFVIFPLLCVEVCVSYWVMKQSRSFFVACVVEQVVWILLMQ